MLLMMLVMAFPLIGLLLFVWLPLASALPAYLVGTLASFWVHGSMRRAMRLPVRTGREGMIGERGVVLVWRADVGQVSCHGEIWGASGPSESGLAPGDEVRVVGVDHLTLQVKPRS